MLPPIPPPGINLIKLRGFSPLAQGRNPGIKGNFPQGITRELGMVFLKKERGLKFWKPRLISPNF